MPDQNTISDVNALPLTGGVDPETRLQGRLKIFLGASPGVGKTHAMLEAARARKAEGVDVVAAAVEGHGALDITEFLTGFEVLPCKKLTWQGKICEELDLDGVVQRKPGLVLIDDFAHANTPGSWHPHRYQDIEQIIDAGIDVYTTLNIQHLAGLNDVVSQIIHVSVENTVPDSVVQMAHDIELIDLPPEEIVQRLKLGKVHVPESEQGALSSLFSLGNLTALRELALRYMAERVDQQMLSYRQAHAISGIWPTRERMIVCISDKPIVAHLVRVAKRSAERRKVPWIALYIETHKHQAHTSRKRGRIHDALRLAEQLGGEAVTLAGDNPTDEILKYATSRNVTQIIVGKSERPRWIAALAPSVTDRLLHMAENIDVLVISRDEEAEELQAETPSTNEAVTRFSPAGYYSALGALAIATIINLLVSVVDAPFHNYAIIYLSTVMLIAIGQGRFPAIFAAVLSVPLFGFFFTEPRYSIDFLNRLDPVTLVIFLLAAFIVSNLADRVRLQVDATRLSERRSKNLYDFNRKVAGAAGLDDVLWAVVHHVASTVGGRAVVMMPDKGALEIVSGFPPEMFLDDISTAAADWAWRQGKPAGRGSNTLPDTEWLFLPLKTARGTLGVLGVHIENRARLPSLEEGRLLDTLTDQAAVAIERTHLAADYEDTRVLMETEKLRTALLSSLSHDLRTPLVSILGSATSLIDFNKSLDEAARLDLCETIREEAERLNHFVQNLLDMTRLGSGALHIKRDWADLADIVGAAINSLKRQIGNRKISVAIEPGLPLLSVDTVLIEQVLVNIIDNACKYSPPKSRITISARRDGVLVKTRICDEGAGIPVSERPKVFDMFYRVKATDTQIAGTGLGLAICRGIIEAHGGTITATDPDDVQGTCIEFSLPVTEPPALEQEPKPDPEET